MVGAVSNDRFASYSVNNQSTHENSMHLTEKSWHLFATSLLLHDGEDRGFPCIIEPHNEYF